MTIILSLFALVNLITLIWISARDYRKPSTNPPTLPKINETLTEIEATAKADKESRYEEVVKKADTRYAEDVDVDSVISDYERTLARLRADRANRANGASRTK